MSLSKQIIYGSVDDVIRDVAAGATLDEIDEYGYTPLIQTAIVNDVQKASVILNAGADVNLSDLTGRTALHWAADNNNVQLCELLLQHHANPNAYSAFGQPVLVKPLLRRYQNVKKMLMQHGGSLDFADDFIHAKLLGHLFELVGQVDIADQNDVFVEMDFEGFYLEFTLSLILDSLVRFKNHYAARNMRPLFDKFKQLITSFRIANELIVYQHYNIDEKQHMDRIDRLLDYELLMIPVACDGHAITFIKYGPLFARCDRGEYGKKHGSVIIYSIGNPQAFSKELVKEMIYTRISDEFVKEGIVDYLNLSPIMTLPLSLQMAGNCSWANVEAAVPTMMFFLCMHEHIDDLSKHLNICKEEALEFYEDWMGWSKRVTLHYFIQNIPSARESRQISMIELIASVLFQACNNDRPSDMPLIKKILAVLQLPQFHFILSNYLDVFYKSYKTPAGEKLMDILDDFGFDVSQL